MMNLLIIGMCGVLLIFFDWFLVMSRLLRVVVSFVDRFVLLISFWKFIGGILFGCICIYWIVSVGWMM